MSPFTFSKALWLAALVLFIVATILAFASTNVTQTHIIGVIAAGLACSAAAPAVA